jgi:microcystin-dependent protein
MTESTFAGTEMEYPPGTIMVWHSTNPPPGWVFCDGNNGTADLRGKFPKCVPDGSTDPGTVAGQHAYSLSTAQLPNHSHSITSIEFAGSHSHTMTSRGVTRFSGTSNDSDVWSGGGGKSVSDSSDFTHSHPFDVSNAGSNESINNEPRYRDARFIQKL